MSLLIYFNFKTLICLSYGISSNTRVTSLDLVVKNYFSRNAVLFNLKKYYNSLQWKPPLVVIFSTIVA